MAEDKSSQTTDKDEASIRSFNLRHTPPSDMVVITSITTTTTTPIHPHRRTRIYTLTCRPTTNSLLHLRHLYKTPTKRNICRSSTNGVVFVKSYMEDSNTISGFANKVIGALPVIGLVARILTDTGGVGGDFIDFAEFRRRVGKNSSVNDSRAFIQFQDRHGRAGDPLYVLMCCWLAALGAGLLKSEEILEGVARLRLSNDIEFEEETFIAMMNEAREKRAKLNVPVPNIPMEARAEKALDAIYVCCFGRDPIEEEDEKQLCVMLNAVFPSVGQPQIARIVKDKARRVAEGGEEERYPEPKSLSKEAVQLQMKDLQFLKQNSDS